MSRAERPGVVLSVLGAMAGGDEPSTEQPGDGVTIGHDGAAWIVEQPSGEVQAHLDERVRFVNSSRAAFDRIRDVFEARIGSAGLDDDTDERLAQELEELVAPTDPATGEHDDSWWRAVIDSVLRC